MNLPETEILTSLVAPIFRIDDVTAGDPRQFIVRYRGQLLVDDSAQAYDQLSAALTPYGITPLFRVEDGRHVILLIPRPADPKPANVNINIVLFILTVFSVMLAGAQPDGPMPNDIWGQIGMLVRNIFSGWPFALSLLGILLAHEFGHYLVSRYHKTAATLPYFIPLPFSPLGTMGAAILMQGTPRNKRVLFDIGVAGPLAGLIVAIPVLWLGLSLSHTDIIQDTVYPALQPKEQAACADPVFNADGSYTCVGDGFIEGNSLLYLGMKYMRFGSLLPAPADYGGQSPFLYWLRYFFTGSPTPFGGTDVMIDPVAFAGWAGLLVTALNLLPAGTLDGGHVVFALFGKKVRYAFPVILVLLGVLGFFWMGWWLWAAILLWLGRVQAQLLDEITPLDTPRRVLAVVVLILFVLVFTPVPFATF
ncbi:MAG: site-2 protease family protein [Chloroflexi bacterium]|nr:site-2 protease family protein [Chloroflexota bacterium]